MDQKDLNITFKQGLRWMGWSFLMVLFSTCQDSLEEVPKAFLTPQNFYETAEDALLAVNASYDHMASGTSNRDFGGVYFSNYWVVQALASDEGYASGANNPQYSLPLTNFTWDANNGYLEDVWEDLYKTINVTNIALQQIPIIEMDEDLKNRFLGECHFIRGLMYFELVRMFGDVPLSLEPTVDLSTISISRTAVAEVYAQIIIDLELARDQLPWAYYGVDMGRATRGAAGGYLTKVYLTLGEWQNAIDEANDIIQSGVHELMPNFGDIFKIENSNNSELLFSVNFTLNNDAIWETSQFNVRVLPVELNKNSLSWELPTQYLYDLFDPSDLRRDVTFKVEWTDSSIGETYTFDPHIFKYWDEAAEPNASSSSSDFFNLRYADLLLMKAEALNELSGPTNEAFELIDQVRSRAGLDDLDITLNKEAFREAILLERTKEFVFEGHRWFDLVRTGKLKEKVLLAKPSVSVDMNRHILFPIPQREINVNPNLVQNPGY